MNSIINNYHEGEKKEENKKKKRPQEHKDLNNINLKRSLTVIKVVYTCHSMLKKFLNLKNLTAR
jgi:hypothetical protein